MQDYAHRARSSFRLFCTKSGKFIATQKNEFHYEKSNFLRKMYIYKNEAMLTVFLYIYIFYSVG